jgi:very-short-patch-repair endonuclease
MRRANAKKYLEKRRALRHRMTEAEVILWSRLKSRQLGLKFRRQHGIGFYILDFYCPSRRLAIEVDGDIHQRPEQRAADIERQSRLEAVGLHFLRFTNEQVKYDLDSVLSVIKNSLKKPLKFSPLKRGEFSRDSLREN